MGIGDGTRYFLLFGAALVFLVGTGLTLFSWRRLGLGQKAFLAGSMFTMLYVVGALYNGLEEHREFKWYLVPLTLGIVSYTIYLLEPLKQRKLRQGQSMFGEGER